MDLFKKLGTKKEDIGMNDNNAGMGERNEVNEEVEQIFGELDRCYAEVKRSIQRELCAYKDMFVRAENEAKIYKNKVQVRDVMMELLPILSDIKNDVEEETSLDDLRKTILIRFKQMKVALHRVGVNLLSHEKYQPVNGAEQLNATVQPTNDPKLHHCVAYTQRMGCVIRGEENNPLFETVVLYQYKKDEKIDDVKDKEPMSNVVASQSQCGQKHNDRQLKIGEPRPDLSANLIRDMPPRADFVMINRSAIRLNMPIELMSQSKRYILFKDGTTFYEGNDQGRNLPKESINDDYNLYVGTIMVGKDVKLGSSCVYCCAQDFSERRAKLVFYYYNTMNMPTRIAEINLKNE